MSHSLKVVTEVPNGTIKTINNETRIYYDGYWIRHYDVPNNLAYKKLLIDQLARRVFHHTESGINTPGGRLEEVREAYEAENNPSKKRVLAAMLAGALLNRGVDILTKLVELEEIGVTISPDNELLKTCGRCFMGALEYGRYIRPVRGSEGLDELWGEPFKAFTMPVEKFHESRYIKIAQTMRGIDSLAVKIISMFNQASGYEELGARISELAESCKEVCETLRSDHAMLKCWPRFVSASDDVHAFIPKLRESASNAEKAMSRRGKDLIMAGAELMIHLSNMRTPLPKSTNEFLRRCDEFYNKYHRRLESK